MDYDFRRYPNQATFAFPNYYMTERNAPLAMSHMARPDPRGCPIGGPMGMRGRSNTGRDDVISEAGSPRRRIAIACARCRKRKIRCSGDPGNGTGCQNCKAAGVDLTMCQFNRVGSTDAMSLATAMAMNNLSGSSQSMLLSPNTTMPIYNAAEASLYTRLAHNSYPQVNTKPIAWTIPYGDDTSPVENYSLEQAASYIPTSNTITSDYGQSYRWSQTQRTPYLEQDTTTGYNSNGVSFIQTSNVRPATTAEPLSPLNLASMNSALPISLPERPYPRRMTTSDVSMPQRQLPMPQPSPAQSTRNTVDLLQDQRLRSAQLYAKPAFPWNVEASDAKSTQSWHDATGSDIQNATASEASSAELMAKASVPVTSVGDLSYMPITAGEDSSSATAQLGQLNFSTSSLLESMAAPASTATYSNFRNHNNSISTSTDALSFLPRQSSQTNLYSYTSDSVAKKHSEGSSNKAALVNGQRYTPLSQHQPHHAASIEGLRQETYKSQHVPLHRASMSNLDRTY